MILTTLFHGTMIGAEVYSSPTVILSNRDYESGKINIIDDFRKNKKHGVLNYKEFQDFESYTDLIDYNQADTDINTEYIYRFINKLPHTSKQVFNLYVVEGYSHKEIAKSLDIAEGTSKWHLSYARKFLQEAILAGTTKTKVLI